WASATPGLKTVQAEMMRRDRRMAVIRICSF
ncbi:hypothetical protein ACSSVZ_005539, partial [Amorphus sp. MBR-141]